MALAARGLENGLDPGEIVTGVRDKVENAERAQTSADARGGLAERR
jgi:hypothetical protein